MYVKQQGVCFLVGSVRVTVSSYQHLKSLKFSNNDQVLCLNEGKNTLAVYLSYRQVGSPSLVKTRK